MHIDRRNTRADHHQIVSIMTASNGMPIMHRGRVIKEIEHTTTMCPECEDEDGENTIAAWVDDRSDEICPECGMVCGSYQRALWPVDGEFSVSPVAEFSD